MMEIRKGSLADIPQIVRIYEHILDEEEQGSAVTGWIRGVYPTEQTALEALEAKELFVLQTDGTVAVAARINQVQVPEYAHASWEFPDAPKEQIMVLHSMSSMPKRGAVCICVWIPMPEIRRHADCTGIWATGRQALFPVNSTGFPKCSWCVLRRL